MGRRSDTGVSQKTCQNRCMFYSFREIKLRNKSGFFYYRQPVRHQATHSSEISPPVSRVRFFPKSQYSRLYGLFSFLASPRGQPPAKCRRKDVCPVRLRPRSEEHTSELQS